MKPETAEWLDKAEGDWKVARREMQAADPVWHVICLLAQHTPHRKRWTQRPQYVL